MSSSAYDLTSSNGSEAIYEKILRSKIKAPDCSVAWQTIEKARFLNQLRLLKFDGLINGQEQFPTRDLQIFYFMKAQLKNPNLTINEAIQHIADGTFIEPTLTISDNNELIKNQKLFTEKTKSLCSFLFQYCEGTKLQHLINKHEMSDNYIDFYTDIIAA